MIGSQVQRALWSRLMDAPPIATGRVWDRAPEKPEFPYVTIGDEQVVDDSDSCSDGWEVFSDIHVWSRPAAGSKAEAKDLSAAIVSRALAGLDVEGFVVLSISLEGSRAFRDADGLTEHCAITFRLILAPAA